MGNNFTVGNYVILRGNCSYNRNVGTGKTGVLLCHGRYSCDDAERDADLVIIMEPVRKCVKFRTYRDDRMQDVEEWHSMVRVMSTKTNNVYEVDTDWADAFTKAEYNEHLEYAIEMAAFDDIINEMMDDLYDDGPMWDDYPW